MNTPRTIESIAYSIRDAYVQYGMTRAETLDAAAQVNDVDGWRITYTGEGDRNGSYSFFTVHLSDEELATAVDAAYNLAMIPIADAIAGYR